MTGVLRVTLTLIFFKNYFSRFHQANKYVKKRFPAKLLKQQSKLKSEKK
jgi:hypothetical protein